MFVQCCISIVSLRFEALACLCVFKGCKNVGVSWIGCRICVCECLESCFGMPTIPASLVTVIRSPLQTAAASMCAFVRLCLFFQYWHDELWKMGTLLCCAIITQHLYGCMLAGLLEVRVWREGSVFWETFLTDIRGIVWRGVLKTPAFREGLFLWETATRVEEGKGGKDCTCSEKGRRSAINQKSKQRPRHWTPWA